MIRALSQQEYRTELQPLVEQLLLVQNFDAGTLEYFFTNHLPERRIIYPCQPQLDDDFILALIEGMRSVQDPGLYTDFQGITTYSTRDGGLATTPSSYYYVPIDQVEYGIGNEGIAETFMDAKVPYLFFSDYVSYSPQGKWSFVVNALGHYGLLAGTTGFIRNLEPKTSFLTRSCLRFSCILETRLLVQD